MPDHDATDLALPEFYAEYTPAAPPAALPRPPLRLSCVVPAFNEAVNLPRFIPALAEAVAQLTPTLKSSSSMT